jgi:hypothetical protein
LLVSAAYWSQLDALLNAIDFLLNLLPVPCVAACKTLLVDRFSRGDAV